MAITWGSAEGHLQVGIDCWTSTPSSSSTSVTVYLRMYVRAADSWRFDDNESYSVSGTGGGSGTFYNGLDGGSKLIYSNDFTAGISYSGGPTYSWTASVSGMYNGGTPQHSRSLTLPERPPAAPAAPSTPSVSSIQPTSATLSWSTPANNGSALIGYGGYVSRSSSFSPVDIDLAQTGWATSRTVTGLAKGTTYYTKVLARNGVGWGSWSGVRSFTTSTTAPGTPGTPSLSSATPTAVTVSWSAPSDNGGAAITSYTVDRATDSGFSSGLTTTTMSGTSLQVTGLSPGTSYWFRVRATNATGTSGTSGSTGFTTGAVPPGAPPMPVLNGVLSTEVTVSYVAPASNGGSGITGYEVQWALSPSFTGAGGDAMDDASPYTIAGLLPGKTYYVRVRALNAAGAGAWSPATFTTTLSGVKVGNGSQWRDAVVRIGNGTDWVLASLKVGNEEGWK